MADGQQRQRLVDLAQDLLLKGGTDAHCHLAALFSALRVTLVGRH
jgi:hypothetical protein